MQKLHLDILAGSCSPIIFDVGANTGQTVKKYRRFSQTAQIFSFEPLEQDFQQLRKNISRDNNCRAYQLALADHSGSATFYVNELTYTSSLNQLSDRADDGWGPGVYATTGSTVVETVSVDDFCGKEAVWPDLIKIDVQGSEASVLRGSSLALKRASIVYLEIILTDTYINQTRPEELFAILGDAGFVLYSIDGMVFEGRRLLQADLTFLKKTIC